MLALDIGIKNLAYCVGEKHGDKVHVKHWSLVNLQDLNQTQQKPMCECGKPAKASIQSGFVCGRHLKTRVQICDESTGEPITKQPTIQQLQVFLKLKGLDTKGQRPALLARASLAGVALPLVKVKSVASFADNTSRLHDAIRDWITRDWNHLKDVRDIYIEHQPVLKNPVMKTVQILIFATLRERLLAHCNGSAEPNFHFVHAGKKVKGAAVGDAGYKDRKAGGEARLIDYMSKVTDQDQQRWYAWWQQQTKKDDLADTLCMLLDATG
jgi:hypothetical protein